MKTFLQHNWWKVSLLIVLLISILVVVSYLKDKNYQEVQQKNKEFAAKQKTACMGIYEQESKKWNNVQSWDYSQITDKCTITYNVEHPKTKEECKANLETAQKLNPDFIAGPLHTYLECLDGTFAKEF